MKDKKTKWFRIETTALREHRNSGAMRNVKHGETWLSAALFSHYEAKKFCKRINALGAEPIVCKPVPTDDQPGDRTVEGKVTQ